MYDSKPITHLPDEELCEVEPLLVLFPSCKVTHGFRRDREGGGGGRKRGQRERGGMKEGRGNEKRAEGGCVGERRKGRVRVGLGGRQEGSVCVCDTTNL